MGGDERRPVRARGAQCLFEPVVDADERAQPERERVAASAGSGSLVGQLEARDDEQVVERRRALASAASSARYAAKSRLDCDSPPGAVVGDREHVEAGAAVQVESSREGELAVAPRRVRVELAEERAGLDGHPPAVFPAPWRFRRAAASLSPPGHQADTG